MVCITTNVKNYKRFMVDCQPDEKHRVAVALQVQEPSEYNLQF